MDEISQDPKLSFRFLRGRRLDVAVAAALIAAAALVVMTGRGSRPAAAPAPRPGTPAVPALLPSTMRTSIRLPFGQPGDMTILGSTAWISDWSASQIVGVDLAAGRVTRTLHVGGQLNEPVSMTSGAGSVWVLDSFGSLLRIDPASGTITKRFPVRGLGADVTYGDGFIWMITDDPADDGGQYYLSKIDPSRDVTVKTAPIPGAGLACTASPGPHGIWISCTGVDHITLINQDSLTPEQSLPVDSGGYAPQIVPGPKAVWVLTPSGLARTDPATGKITAIIHTSYASSTMSAPALIMDSAGRLWITGSLLTVVMPDTLTAYPVAHTPDLISAAANGPAIWIDTGSTLASLQARTPHATSAADQRPPRSDSLTAHQAKATTMTPRQASTTGTAETLNTKAAEGKARAGNSAPLSPGQRTHRREAPNRRSVIVRANYNVPACHATRPRGALIKPIAAHPDRGRCLAAHPPGASGTPAHGAGSRGVPIGRKVRLSCRIRATPAALIFPNGPIRHANRPAPRKSPGPARIARPVQVARPRANRPARASRPGSLIKA